MTPVKRMPPEKHQSYIDAHERHHQDHHIGQHLEDVVIPYLDAALDLAADQIEQHQAHQGRRQSDGKIHPELVPHFGSAPFCRRNGGVRDHRKVVPEIRAADHRCTYGRCVEPGPLGHSDGHRSHGCNGPHAGADGRRDEAADQEHPWDQERRRDELEAEVHYGSLASDGSCCPLESPGQEVDQHDHHDPGISHAGTVDFQFFVNGSFLPKVKRHQGPGQECHMPGQVTEGFGEPHKGKTEPAADIQAQEHQKGQERQSPQAAASIVLIHHLFLSEKRAVA